MVHTMRRLGFQPDAKINRNDRLEAYPTFI